MGIKRILQVSRKKKEAHTKDEEPEWLQTSQEQQWMVEAEGGRLPESKKDDFQSRIVYPGDDRSNVKAE